MKSHQVGDLVHIPQAVILIDCDMMEHTNPQLTIPLRIEETDSPKVGVITSSPLTSGYVRVYCDGTTWSVKNDRLYSLSKVE